MSGPEHPADEERFQQRLEQELEEARYAKWKKEKLGYDVAPTKSPANPNIRRGAWTAISGGILTIAMEGTILEWVGLLVVSIGIVPLYLGLFQEKKRRDRAGI